ncbi:DNA-binding response regulator [Actinoplanes sp. NBRC 14428]|uniref:LuxR family two component transcriptional regulator n=1 Tax=Pseudosporangium ferrugineum TaxID=439699 RepID=A0A2T0SBU1_9ACTN|nr:response regulator transcription factor [Pseudosporangium ferrugineum]PRY30783.1 LuxR family two component transcriptional regulator [Pseudosporangium ferrugineum]BCJ50341.1 DNA-binding response regulator [Actinoplanes sp. NBRC 14428]
MSIRVLLADDQALIRAGFRMIIDADPGLEVVGEAADGAEAVELCHSGRVDVVLMDIRMPHVDGIEATRRISADERLAGVRVLILTTFDDDDNVIYALQAGASGFLGKDVAPGDLVNAIRVVAAGEALLSPRATSGLVSRLIGHIQPTRQDPPELELVTDREKEILLLVAHGLSNEAIAERLYLSRLTVKTHINRTMMKLDARDRAQLVVFAYQHHLVRPGDSLPPAR